MGGRTGRTQPVGGAEQVARRLQSAVGTESAALLSELSEVLAICHLQLTRGRNKDGPGRAQTPQPGAGDIGQGFSIGRKG